uniref:Uncharacterized protein n=1 Tax=Amphora coffeiformis TaxID=265554 RepID=A0A6S8MBR8_9STRA
MINTQAIPSSINLIAKPNMKGQQHRHHNKRRKPILSLGRRMGRKGDPRMHRAVQAKLADPNMSLFHALKAGGFNYVDDIDAKAVDEENVTLAQRKNQLSRRLRVAKNPESDGSVKPQESDDECEKSHQTLDDLMQAQRASFQSLLQQETGGASVASAESHNYPDKSSRGEQQHEGRHVQQDYSVFPDHTADNNDSNIRPIGFTPNELINCSDVHLPRQDTKMGRAVALPTYGKVSKNPMFSDPFGANEPPTQPQPPSRTLDRAMSEPIRRPSHQTSEVPSFASSSHHGGSMYSRLGSRHVTTGSSAPLCSEFGLRSLHRTAQSVGLTLDQFALVLSSTENLSSMLGIHIHNDNHTDQSQGQAS